MNHLFPHLLVAETLGVTDRSGGVVRHGWTAINSKPWPCRLDISFRRPQDPLLPPEAGRQPDRQGTLFLSEEHGVQLKPGCRLLISRYHHRTNRIEPYGTFDIKGSLDEAIAMSEAHHFEIAVSEHAKGVD